MVYRFFSRLSDSLPPNTNPSHRGKGPLPVARTILETSVLNNLFASSRGIHAHESRADKAAQQRGRLGHVVGLARRRSRRMLFAVPRAAGVGARRRFFDVW